MYLQDSQLIEQKYENILQSFSLMKERNRYPLVFNVGNKGWFVYI